MKQKVKTRTVKIGKSTAKESKCIGVNPPLASLFLGPHAENSKYWEEAISTIFTDYVYWRKNYYSKDGNLMSASDYQKGDTFHREFSVYLDTMLNDLKQSYPFHSPRYMGHMLSEQTLPAVMGYFATLLYNPNNVTEEAAPVTVEKELEFGKRICQMLGYGSKGWAHLSSGGSSANLEALWAARQSQFFPLVLRDVCLKYGWSDFTIKLPNHRDTNLHTPLCACSDRQLLHLHPSESLFMLKNLTQHIYKTKGLEYAEIKKRITEAAAASQYNIRTNGYANVIAKIGLKPVIFVSQSAHYSVKKATNLLGYGESSIRPIPTTDKFRINIPALKDLLYSVKEDEYIAAVIAVFGTTEEGAIDPVHRVKWLRDSLAMEKNLSFWLHVDAAWGGYFAVMKNEGAHPDPDSDQVEMNEKDFFDRVDQYIARINVSETYEMSFEADFPNYKETYQKPQKLVSWNDREVFASMFALCDADSITVDPHKMGYIPYPAGLVAFKNKRIVYLLKEHASYIGTDSRNFSSEDNSDEDMNFYKKDDLFDILQIGAYTLEGSRPGAAAMACWFASEIIPLDIKNHGKIIRTTVLNARRFAQYLQQHSNCTFRYIDEKLQQESDSLKACNVPFKIELLYNNIDTNLVCFFVRPCRWVSQSGNRRWKMEPDDTWTLEEINNLNRRIHERMTISRSREADLRKNTLNQKFYVAGTNLETNKYSAESMSVSLKRFGFQPDEYAANGLYVMRSTIMNPWYYKAAQSANHIDYFMEFLEELHYATRKVLDASSEEHNNNQ